MSLRFALWSAVLVVVILAAVAFYVLRPIDVRERRGLPPDFPEDSFSHQSFEELLQRFVSPEGDVDYTRWQADPQAVEGLERYLGAVATLSPDNAPSRFPEKADQIAYWMYAYNALVISAVLERYPIESVTDVKAPIEVVRGLGFFYKLRFLVGGKRLSLYEIEHDKVIAQAEDPRVHFVLNCGSGGCPAVRPELPTGAELEPFLASSAAAFVAEKRNVRIDHKRRELTLSKIFSWYEEDFVAELRRRGLPSQGGVAAYLPLVAQGPLQEELKRAANYQVTFSDYDWSLNESK